MSVSVIVVVIININMIVVVAIREGVGLILWPTYNWASALFEFFFIDLFFVLFSFTFIYFNIFNV